jgi:hypothetical protein
VVQIAVINDASGHDLQPAQHRSLRLPLIATMGIVRRRRRVAAAFGWKRCEFPNAFVVRRLPRRTVETGGSELQAP